MKVTLSCGHIVESEESVFVGEIVRCPECRDAEREVREVEANSDLYVFGTVRTKGGLAIICYDPETDTFGYKLKDAETGIRICETGFQTPSEVLQFITA